MKLKTSAFGVQDYDEQSVLHLLEGMLGFSRLNRYVLIERGDLHPFQWLQSLDDTDLAFLVVDPRLLVADYTRQIPVQELERLQIQHPSDLLTLAVAIVQKDPTKSSVNLKAPLLINHKRMIGRQVVLAEARLDMRTRLQTARSPVAEVAAQCFT